MIKKTELAKTNPDELIELILDDFNKQTKTKSSENELLMLRIGASKMWNKLFEIAE